ncbi:MAG: hypothetical protein U0289_11570 [Cyclobacteriaceae bacterium]|nr:hypothetical protein [Cytophagales bacterium]HNP76985.1 hypothetical protein [Cyclobacteriaceae bacterium]
MKYKGMLSVWIVVLIQAMNLRCDFYCKSFNGEERLGNGFTLVNEDVKRAYVMFCLSKGSCCDMGIDVIPSKVIALNYDERWIIASSEGEEITSYWIVNKAAMPPANSCKSMDCAKILKSNTWGPLSMKEFGVMLDSLEIGMKLEVK